MEKELIVSAKIDNLRHIEKFIDQISSDVKLSSELYGNVLIAMLEAANNAIVHGNKLDEKKNVIIKAISNNTHLIISMEDEGPGFDYSNIPDPTSPENIENISGRGVFLMRKLSDNVIFEKNGAYVEIHFKL